MDADRPALTDSERRRSLAAVIACIGVVGIAMGLTYPLLSLLMEARGVSRTVIGLSAAMPALAMLVFSPTIPRLVAIVGLKWFLLGCIGTEAAMVASLKAVDDVYGWFPIRFVMGASAAGLFVAGETWLNQIAREATRGRLMAIYTIVLSAGFGAGPLIIAGVGIDGWLPFQIGIGCILLGALPLAWTGNLAPRLTGKASFGVLSFVRIAPSLAAAILVFSALESTSGGLLAVYGVRSGLGYAAAATMMTMVLLGSLAFQLPVGWLADRVERYRLMLQLGALTALGTALLPLAVGAGAWLWATLFVWGGLGASIYTVALAIQGERFKGAELITANAAFGVLWGVGSMAGPAIGGVAMDLWDPHGLPLTLTFALAAFVAVVTWRRRARRPVRA